jgi:hypothetical protein
VEISGSSPPVFASAVAVRKLNPLELASEYDMRREVKGEKGRRV